ncbi:hypothetical protein ACH5RR_010368 [Cinchona calisaya]|uniref:Uncharacterized protein n=1 Tax=Cinchona calisaya TaxID=153742 RepID=A0ABD3AIR6_9GENT
MDEEYYFNRGKRRGSVPAFGSWGDCSDDLPFTQCFETARQDSGLLRYGYSDQEDRDLYVAGDLYENDVVTPAMILVPRRRVKSNYPRTRGKGAAAWVVCDCECGVNVKQPPSPPPPSPPKAVDEDLYKISPELLRAKPRNTNKKRGCGFFSNCLQPSRVR